MEITFTDKEEAKKEKYHQLVTKHKTGVISKEEELELCLFYAKYAHDKGVGVDELLTLQYKGVSARIATQAASFIRVLPNGYYEAQLEELAGRKLLREYPEKPTDNEAISVAMEDCYVSTYHDIAVMNPDETLLKELNTLPPTEFWKKYVPKKLPWLEIEI